MFKRAIIQNKLFEGIMGKDEFLKYQETLTKDNKNELVVISITEPDSDEFVSAMIDVSEFHDILELKFWDVEEAFGNYAPLSDDQANQIREFILKHSERKFLIHCKAGMSRSAGVGKAVECLVNYKGDVYSYRTSPSEIDKCQRYSPNQTVFDKITKI